MTDKEIIRCKYKFQNNDKFNGKDYCTLFNEVCSDVEFVCDKNCQVFEDYKQLKRLEQENAELKAENERLKERQINWFNQEANVYKQTLQEIKAICKMDCGDCPYNQDCDCNYQECEEAKIDDILDLITKAEINE